MIRELQINNKNMEVFKKLIPKQYQNEIERGSLTSFGFFDDEAIPGEKIAGVVLVRRFGRWIEIEYMSQSDLYAGEMYGAKILDTLIGLIKFSPVDYVGCYTKLYPDEKKMHDLFDYVGFKFSKARDGIYEFTFDMVDVDRLVGTEKNAVKCIKLRDADSKLLSEVERKLCKDARALPLSFPISFGEHDQDMSMIYRDENTCGLMLCSINDDYMMIDTMVSQGPKSTGALLGALFMNYEKNCYNKKTISVPVINDEAKKLIKHIVPGARQKEIMLGCYYL